MSEIINLNLTDTMMERVNSAGFEARFVSRMEFLRYLLDMALTEWERGNA